MSEEDKFTQKLIRGNRTHTEEELALLISEDKRLLRLGIDPDGDPQEILRLLQQKIDELNDKKD